MSTSSRAGALHRAPRGRRRVDASALVSLAPVLALAPVCALALGVVWAALHPIWGVSYAAVVLGYLTLGSLLLVRPVQVRVLGRLLGTRPPTAEERARLDTSWRSVLQAAGVPRRRYVLAVLPADDLNAFACGGHLVVVTSLAVDTLPRDELAGVLAHELSHHLGFHTVALTVTHWLSAPVLLLARIGFFLQNVARAATSSFAADSAVLTALGRAVSAVLTAMSWVFLAGLVAADALGGRAARGSEFDADARAVLLGFGPELGNALRRTVAATNDRPGGPGRRLAASHPPPRTRVARIDALTRRWRRQLRDAS